MFSEVLPLVITDNILVSNIRKLHSQGLRVKMLCYEHFIYYDFYTESGFQEIHQKFIQTFSLKDLESLSLPFRIILDDLYSHIVYNRINIRQKLHQYIRKELVKYKLTWVQLFEILQIDVYNFDFMHTLYLKISYQDFISLLVYYRQKWSDPNRVKVSWKSITFKNFKLLTTFFPDTDENLLVNDMFDYYKYDFTMFQYRYTKFSKKIKLFIMSGMFHIDLFDRLTEEWEYHTLLRLISKLNKFNVCFSNEEMLFIKNFSSYLR